MKLKRKDVENKVSELTKKYFADRGHYIEGRCKECGENGLILLVSCGQYTLRCYYNPEHENDSGWV